MKSGEAKFSPEVRYRHRVAPGIYWNDDACLRSLDDWEPVPTPVVENHALLKLVIDKLHVSALAFILMHALNASRDC